jgi:hypothetical protein
MTTALALFYSRATLLAHLLREFLAHSRLVGALSRHHGATHLAESAHRESRFTPPLTAAITDLVRHSASLSAQGHRRTTANLVCALRAFGSAEV